MATGKPAAAKAAATTVSNPPVASRATTWGESPRSRATRASRPRAFLSTANASPLGRTATSRRSFDTSIPTMMFSMATRPCLIELRALRPRRLFGFDGLTGGIPSSPTVFNDLGEYEPPPATARPGLSESRQFKLQGEGAADCLEWAGAAGFATLLFVSL